MQWYEYAFIFWMFVGTLFVVSYWAGEHQDLHDWREKCWTHEEESSSKEDKNGN